jgi:hypothetical protein
MADTQLITALNILTLAAGLEPAVLQMIMTLMGNSQGMTGDQFLAQADGIWANVIATANKEIGK